MTGWEVYWLTRLDAIHEIAGVICGISIITIALGAFSCMMEHDIGGDESPLYNHCLKALKVGVLSLMLSGGISLLVPTLKEVAAIYLIPPIVNNEDVREIPEDAAKLLHNKLEEWIDDTTKGDK